MVQKKGKEGLEDFFGDKGNILVLGFLSALYFVLQALPKSPWAVKLLPPFPWWYYLALGLVAILFQVFSWKILRLFEGVSYKDVKIFFMLAAEFFLILFTLGVLSWPIYYIFISIVHPAHPVPPHRP